MDSNNLVNSSSQDFLYKIERRPLAIVEKSTGDIYLGYPLKNVTGTNVPGWAISKISETITPEGDKLTSVTWASGNPDLYKHIFDNYLDYGYAFPGVIPAPVGNLNDSPKLSNEQALWPDDGRIVGTSALVADIAPGGLTTTVRLDYGPDTNYGTSIDLDPIAATFDITPRSTILRNLKPGKYHFRFVATNTMGTTAGQDQEITVYPGIGRSIDYYLIQINAAIASMTGTNYYIDPSAGVNGTGTIQSPFNTYPATLGGDNKYYQKYDTVYTAPAGTLRTINGRCLIGAYGFGSERPKIRAGVNAGEDFIASTNQLIVMDMDIEGYRSGGKGTELGRGIRLRNNADGADMNHWVYNCKVHNFEFGIDTAINTGNYFRNVKILFNEVYDTSLDGMYPTGLTEYEIAYNYIHDVNNYWFIDENQSNSSGDAIQMAFANGAIPTIHMVASIHHNTIDRTATRNKFGIIWNEQLEGESITVYNNHFICPLYSEDTSHPVTAIYAATAASLPGGKNNSYIFNNIFEGGEMAIASYTEGDAIFTHNVFINVHFPISNRGGAGADIYNNIFKDYRVGAISAASPSEVNCANNVFDSTYTNTVFSGTSGLILNSNNHFVQGTTYGTNFTTGPAGFADAVNKDFRLLPGSLLKDSGIDVGVLKDFTGANNTIPISKGLYD